jgi:hypothetical protein
MTNKTIQTRVVTAASSFTTIADHALVIVNEAKGGRVHQQTVMPGEKPKISIFGRDSLVGYHVTLDERLRHEFGSQHLHFGGVHTFSLRFFFSFRVARDNLQAIVLRLPQDPVALIEEEAKRVLAGPVVRLPWDFIDQNDDMTQVATEARSLDDSGEYVINGERLRAYAHALGIEIRLVQVVRHLDDRDREVARAEEEHKRASGKRSTAVSEILDEARIGEAKIVAKSRIDQAAAHAEMQAHLTGVVNDALGGMRVATKGITESARSFADIQTQLVQARGVVETARGFGPALTAANGEARPLSSTESELLLIGAGDAAEPGAGSRNFGAIFARASEVCAALPCKQESDRDRFLAAILKLLAARLEARADEEARAAKHLADLHVRYAQDMQEAHNRFVSALTQQG